MTQEKVEGFDELDGKIPVMDKRRFNADGSRNAEVEAAAAKPAEAVRSAAETALEAQLKAEVERREAAEAKLVGVQAKFEEAKASIERETQEMRDRMKRSLEDRATQAQFNFLLTLLPVLDNLDLAIQASKADGSVEHLRDGVIGTARSFEQALASVGVEAVPGAGSDFDPEIHDAVDTVDAGPENAGKVTEEYSRGYKLGDRLLRAARVQVGRA
ncbi:MAG: heat shock protein GrpE [Acidobacteria bacterium OLB17]|nr:MAG: heat shock protein GrpE [Acidobacteria bacterium OLB17]MCZ2390398.1 nucleotide exchange factor GrpE [Acidobacteriota bacterium]